MHQPSQNEENTVDDNASDEAKRLANGPEQTPGVEGLGAAGAEESESSPGAGDAPETDEPSDTRLANGPVQTPGVEGLGAEGSTS